MSEQQQSQLKKLIARGKEKGFLTYAEVNDHLPDDIVDPEQIEDIIAMINDMGIEVHEFVPDTETLLLNENPASADDDVVAEVNVRGVVRTMFAAQTQRNVRSQTANNDAFSVDDHPLIHGISRFYRNGLHAPARSLSQTRF